MINKQKYYQISIEAAHIQIIPCANTQKSYGVCMLVCRLFIILCLGPIGMDHVVSEVYY